MSFGDSGSVEAQ